MDDIVYKIINDICNCLIKNDKCKEEGCDKCLKEAVNEVSEYMKTIE